MVDVDREVLPWTVEVQSHWEFCDVH
jgi:hypothetical protein